MKFLKIFSKKEPEKEPETEDLVGSAVTYSIDETGEIFIDVTVSGFDDENIRTLANLLVAVAGTRCHISTMEMLKDNFVSEGEEEQLNKLVNIVVAQQLLNASEELLDNRKAAEEPCIKPSDML